MAYVLAMAAIWPGDARDSDARDSDGSAVGVHHGHVDQLQVLLGQPAFVEVDVVGGQEAVCRFDGAAPDAYQRRPFRGAVAGAEREAMRGGHVHRVLTASMTSPREELVRGRFFVTVRRNGVE